MLREIRGYPVHHHTLWLALLAIALTLMLLLLSARAVGWPLRHEPQPIPGGTGQPVPVQPAR